MADRKRDPQFNTPKGTFVYPRLNEPDTKFDDDGVYSVKLVLTPEEAAPLLAKLEPLHAQAIKDGKEKWDGLKAAVKKKNPFKENPLYTDEYDDDDNETGNLVFNFKMKASGVNKKTGKAWERTVPMFDAKGKPLTGDAKPSVWGGTVGRINFTAGGFFTATAGAGLSLRLSAVKIIDLVSGGMRDASSYGFDEDEDGYEGEDEQSFPDDADDSEGGDADDEDMF